MAKFPDKHLLHLYAPKTITYLHIYIYNLYIRPILPQFLLVHLIIVYMYMQAMCNLLFHIVSNYLVYKCYQLFQNIWQHLCNFFLVNVYMPNQLQDIINGACIHDQVQHIQYNLALRNIV